MHIKAVAVTLPNPRYVFTIHSHTFDSHAKWGEEDREDVERILAVVDDMYRNPKQHKDVSPKQKEAILVDGLDRRKALQRVYPCIITAERRGRKDRFLDIRRDSVSIQGVAGTADQPGGFHHIVISRGGPFHPNLDILKYIARRNRLKNPKAIGEDGRSKPLEEFSPGDELMDGNSGNRIDLNDLKIRSDLSLVGMVRAAEENASETGYMKVVMVPNDVDPVLSNNRGGEIITEIARIWN